MSSAEINVSSQQPQQPEQLQDEQGAPSASPNDILVSPSVSASVVVVVSSDASSTSPLSPAFASDSSSFSSPLISRLLRERAAPSQQSHASQQLNSTHDTNSHE